MDLTDKRDVNLYLFYEFGLDGDEAQVSDTWPFQLHEAGTIKAGRYESEVYQFSHDGEDYFALDLDGLTFYAADGITVEHLQLQEAGRLWLDGRNPYDLSTVRLGDPSVPSTGERRAAIQELAGLALGVAPESVRVLEGLFFKEDGTYLSLMETDEHKERYIIGSKIGLHRVEFSAASSWRQLALGIGEMLRAGSLTPDL